MLNRNVVLCAVALVALGGCDKVKDKMGLTRHAPDEFAVMQRAPLEIPTNLNTLPVPTPGAPRPQDVSAVVQAQEAVLGQKVSVASDASTAEAELLAKTGANVTNSSIRSVLDKEAKDEKSLNVPVVKKLFGVGGDENKDVIDAKEEAARLKTLKEKTAP